MTMKKRLKIPPYLPSTLVTAIILYLTLAPAPLPDTGLPLFPGADKLVHAAMFGALAYLLIADTARSRHSTPHAVTALFICIAVALFGGAIELLQKAMNLGRGAEWLDFLSDALGAFLAWILWQVLKIRIF